MAETEHGKPKGRPLITERDSEPHGPPPGTRRPATPVTRALVSVQEVIRIGEGEVVDGDGPDDLEATLARKYWGARNSLIQFQQGVTVTHLSELWNQYLERVVNDETLRATRLFAGVSVSSLPPKDAKDLFDVVDIIAARSRKSSSL